MRDGARAPDHRIRGIGIKARFVLAMTAALSLVMLATGYVLYSGVRGIIESSELDTLRAAVRLTQQKPHVVTETRGVQDESGVQMHPFRFDGGQGTLFGYGPADDHFQLLVPEEPGLDMRLLKLFVAILAVVLLVGAVVARWAADQVARSIHVLIDDVGQIARGDLHHRTRAVGTGELGLLARSIDRMSQDLEQARRAELELSVHERERELAGGVREALLPLATPLVAGYDLGAAFLGAPQFGGDFHDFIVREDGRVGLLVCDVAGIGIPAALVGATARSYLRSELERSVEVPAAMQRVNRWLADDVRRGMFVTALYALVDPRAGKAAVVSAGHKVPLLRYSAADGHLRVIHPEGIALGFDRGAIFDRRLQLVEVPIESGDRLVLANSAPLALPDAEGRELGEKGFYARIQRHAALDSQQFLKQLRRDLEQVVGQAGFPRDISLVTLSRQS